MTYRLLRRMAAPRVAKSMLKTSSPNGNRDTALRGHLFECYGGFANKKIKDLAKERRFFVDDREHGGLSSDGLYGWFCGIVADVESDDEVQVTLHGSIPNSPQVNETFSRLGAFNEWGNLCFKVRREQLPLLKSLAKQIRDIVAPGHRYNVPSYKYMCPRTADSLERLAGHLEDYWRQ
jgi:hypothetical protein